MVVFAKILFIVAYFYNLHDIVDVCLSVSVFVFQWTKFQPKGCISFDAIFAKCLITALARSLLKFSWRCKNSIVDDNKIKHSSGRNISLTSFWYQILLHGTTRKPKNSSYDVYGWNTLRDMTIMSIFLTFDLHLLPSASVKVNCTLWMSLMLL